MKTKITQFIPALLALISIGFRYLSNWCIDSISSCYGSWIHQMYQYLTSPLYFFSLFFLPVALILIFVPRTVFNSWLKLAAWMVPLSVLYIASTPVVDTSWLPFYRDDAARLAGGTFAVLSLILIIWKWFSTRRVA